MCLDSYIKDSAFTVAFLADRSGLSRAGIYKLAKGKVNPDNVTVGTLTCLASALMVSPLELLMMIRDSWYWYND